MLNFCDMSNFISGGAKTPYFGSQTDAHALFERRLPNFFSLPDLLLTKSLPGDAMPMKWEERAGGLTLQIGRWGENRGHRVGHLQRGHIDSAF